MSHVALLSPPPPEDGSPIQELFRDPTVSQIGTLLAIVGVTKEYLIVPTEVSSTREIHPDARAAAASSCVMAFGQLDNILNDMSRWQGGAGNLEKCRRELITEHTRTAKLLAQAHSEARRPSVLLSPALLPQEDGTWSAVMLESGVTLGRGVTPEKALEDFDKNFVTARKQQEVVEGRPKRRRAPRPKSG